MLIYIIRSCECRTVADRSAISCSSIGHWLAIDWRLLLKRICMIAERSTTVWRPVGNRSAIIRRLKTVLGLSATTTTCRRPVANQSPTSPPTSLRPPKHFYDRFGPREVLLAANKTLRPNRPWDLPVTSAICRRPVGHRLVTSLQPPYGHSK